MRVCVCVRACVRLNVYVCAVPPAASTAQALVQDTEVPLCVFLCHANCVRVCACVRA